MLEKCPECGLPVSDKAFNCPHCGYPLKNNDHKSTREVFRKRKRLPNGFGQISELKGRNLRNPFRVMVTVGFDKNGRPICKTLKPHAYFKTYNDAYQALMEYNKNPYSLDVVVTCNMAYENWLKSYVDPNRPMSDYRWHTRSWSYFKQIYDTPIRLITPYALKEIVETCNISDKSKVRMKTTLNLIFDHAVESGYIESNPARKFKLSKEILKGSEEREFEHIDFTDEEMNKLWKNIDSYYVVSIVLIQCCMGWRPSELCSLELENIDLNNWFIVGGSKTEAGKNRVVPIHPAIRELVKKWYYKSKEIGNKHLFFVTDSYQCNTEDMDYQLYKKRFEKCMDMFEIKGHRPHDPRVHFITTCKKYNVDEYAIKRMVGHVITDVTENSYTKRDVEWLHKELAKCDM